MKNSIRNACFLALVLVVSACPAYAIVVAQLYAVSRDNTNIYSIDISTGAVTIASSTAECVSVSAAADNNYLYYWSAEGSHRGLMQWDPLTDTHTMINDQDISEENATIDLDGTMWMLDRTNSLVDRSFIHDDTWQLYTVDKTSGVRDVNTILPDVGGYAAGDITWGPDGKLYISTNNTFWRYDTVSNYIWDPVTEIILDKSGDYHAGLIWIDGKLYGSQTINGTTGAVFELDPTDFSHIRQVATMPTGVTIGDLAATTIPEPATMFLLAFGACLFRKRRVSKS